MTKKTDSKTVKVRYTEHTCACCGRHILKDDMYGMKQTGSKWQWYHLDCMSIGN